MRLIHSHCYPEVRGHRVGDSGQSLLETSLIWGNIAFPLNFKFVNNALSLNLYVHFVLWVQEVEMILLIEGRWPDSS